ncbi:hypothetical protein K488DRAFT_86334 [Vararia minispora EC-137]|uniref:Uncharacterized protein n=1 Tax=Vararia minispora EC-137 TaxID=1314806 RepID=A0ACB8QJV9_9AGAM|nr:hypothetical protein K488DRAFT_86334 [Vararia minispora EC-137]
MESPSGPAIPPPSSLISLAQSVGLNSQDFLDLIKLEHVLAGIYIWEYFTTLDIEWHFYRGGKQGVVSTAWIYSLCKLSALTYTIINLIGLNVTSPTAISCEAWIVSRFSFATLAVMCASALTVIRISALWDRNILAVMAAFGTSLAFAALWLRQSVLSRKLATFVPELGCEYVATTDEKPLAIAILVVSVVYLILLTSGLLKRGVFGQPDWWRALYVQGVAWLVLASGFAIPGVVLLYANINGAWNQMLRGPEFLIIVIGATRLYSTLMTGGSFATYRDDLFVSNSNAKPSQLEAVKFRTPGANPNTVTVELSIGGPQSRGTAGNQEYHATGPAVVPEPVKIREDSLKDINQAELSTDSDVLYIGQEKTEPAQRL